MSYTYPRQLKGIGMSRMAANQEIENSYYLDSNKVGLDQLLAPDNSWVREQFVARINSTAVLSAIAGVPVRWAYNMARQIFPATTNIYDQTVADVDALTFTGYNLYEWEHLSGTLGDGTLYGNLPFGTVLTPVAGIVMVTAYRTVQTNGSTDIIYLFDRNNGYECPEEGGGE